MNSRHFLRKGDKENEEVYQIFGSSFDSKSNQHTSPLTSLKSVSLTKLTSSSNQNLEDQTVSINANNSNSSTKIYFDDKEEEDEDDEEGEDESRICHIVLDFDDVKLNYEEKGKVRKEIKVDYFQLARLSRKFQEMKQFFYFPFIKRFKFDIKSINEDTFLEFIKSTQGEEFKITERNYYELYHLSKEWGTYELTSILKDYGKRFENNMKHIIEQYIYLTKEYDHEKEEKIGNQLFNRREKYNKIEEENKYKSNKNKDKDKDKDKEEHKIILKNKSKEIKKVEEIIKNRIEECFKSEIFWKIRIDTIHRLIKETSKQDYSHDLLFERIIESIEERKELIELIDPLLISETNHKNLVDLQYNLVKEWKNKKQINRQHKYNSNFINMNLIYELLQSYQESDYNDNKIRNQNKLEEINQLKRELEEKEKEIEQKGKELNELREREMNFFNEIKELKENIKENIKDERKEVERKEKEIEMRESEVKRTQKEVKNKKIENQTREKENARREETNKQNEEENEKRRKEVEIREKEVEIREKEVQEREEKVEKDKNINENKEKEINKNKKENEMKKEEIRKQEENIVEREKKIEENKKILEKEKISFEIKMKDEEEKIREKVKQQQKLIEELQKQVERYEAEIEIQLQQAAEAEMETFLRENNLKSIDDRDGSGWEAIHIACRNGNDKIVSYILSKNPNKLNVELFFYFDKCSIIFYIYRFFNNLINGFSSNNLFGF